MQDKVKAVVETVVKVNLNEKKKFFSGEITYKLFIVLSRLPKADAMINAVEKLSLNSGVSIDNL